MLKPLNFNTMTLPDNGSYIDLFGRSCEVNERFLSTLTGHNRSIFGTCGFSIETVHLEALYKSLGVLYSSADFPEVTNKRELQTLVSYMHKHGENLRKPSFSVGDEVWINEHKMVVRQNSSIGLYFLWTKDANNWGPFKSLGGANSLYSEIIGASPDNTGFFPFCRSLAELTTFVDELRRRLNLPVFRSRTTTDVASSVAIEREAPLPGLQRRHQIEPNMCVYDITEEQQRTLVKAVEEAHPRFGTLSNWPFGNIGQIWFDAALKAGTAGRLNTTSRDKPVSYEEMLSRLKGT